MPKIKNISTCGDLDVPLLRRIVEANETVEVTKDQAERLLTQPAIFEAVDKAAKDIQADVSTAATNDAEAPADEEAGQ
jgi:hypothetical protein